MFSDMTHRERIIAAFDHQPTDRVPTDWWGVPEITDKMFRHLGARPGDWVDFANKLDIDKVMYVGPTLIADRPNIMGVPQKIVPLPDGSGVYEEPEYFPLADFETIEEIEASDYVFPTTDMFDYSTIAQQCEQYKDFAITGGYISLTYFYECIRGTEQMLIDFIAYPEVAEYILQRLEDFHYDHVKKILEAAQGKIDYAECTDDLGSQHSLLMSPAIVDHFLGKHYDRNIAMFKEYGARVFHHDDGAMTQILPWLMDKGIEILNPLQWHLPGWDLRQLKQTYGDRLCFHGGIDNQHVLPFGTTQEIRDEVYACCDQLYSDGTGYVLGPCHNIQAITPIENILEMYKTAKEYKR